MATANVPEMHIPTAVLLRQLSSRLLPSKSFIMALLGPAVGLFIWMLPLAVNPAAHLALALAIVGFMIVYWITEPIDPGMTAIIGCFLFWAFQVVPSTIAFTTITPWYVFGSMLMGQAAARSGLAKRIGSLILHMVGISYSRLLLGLITMVFALNLFIPSPVAQITTLAPIVIGIAAGLGVGPHSNVAKGLFIALTYTASLFNKMFLNGNVSIMVRGIIETQTGAQVRYAVLSSLISHR